MCAALEINDKTLRPGRMVPVWVGREMRTPTWAGFARSETLRWWQRNGGELVDIPAHRFAERSDRTRQLIWDDIPEGMVVRGLLDPNGGKPLLKVVTRASTPEELARYEHARMPLLDRPLFSAEIVPLVEAEAQQELW